MLSFKTGDGPTDRNLERLDRLASIDRFDGRGADLGAWLDAVLQSIKLLPPIASKHFTGNYHLGEAYYYARPEARSEKWRQLVYELKEHVAAAHADLALKQSAEPTLALKDRPITRSEHLLQKIKALEQAGWNSDQFRRCLIAVEQLAVGGIRADVAELRDLSTRKRISDVTEHTRKIQFHIEHMRLIAAQQHHLV